MAPEWAVQKNFKLLKYEHIIYSFNLKHVIWRFLICNYFCEIFRFRDFMNTSRNFAKSVFAHIFVKFKYFEKQSILTESPDHVLYICSYFKSLKCFWTAILEPLRCNSRKLLIKSRNQNVFSISKMNQSLW